MLIDQNWNYFFLQFIGSMSNFVQFCSHCWGLELEIDVARALLPVYLKIIISFPVY